MGKGFVGGINVIRYLLNSRRVNWRYGCLLMRRSRRRRQTKRGRKMTNAEIDLYIAKLYKEAEVLKERDRLKEQNTKDLKKAWKRFLKGEKRNGESDTE